MDRDSIGGEQIVQLSAPDEGEPGNECGGAVGVLEYLVAGVAGSAVVRLQGRSGD